MKKTKNTYFLLRHGETEYQKEKKGWIYPRDGMRNVSLSKEGKEQVQRTAEKMREEEVEVDVIYSSDFLRAKETSEIVRASLSPEKVFFDERLRDVDLGVYHERRKEDFYKDFPLEEGAFERRPPEGENYRDAMERVIDLVLEIEKKRKGERILLVSHKDILLFLEGWFLDLKESEILRIKKERGGPRTAQMRIPADDVFANLP